MDINWGGGRGGGKGGFSPPKYVFGGELNVPGVLPEVNLSTVMYSYSRSFSLTSLLRLTMHTNRLELGPNSQALILFLWSQADPSQSIKGTLFDRGAPG